MKPQRLNDVQLAEHAAAYKTHKVAAAAAELLAEAEKDLVITEMTARKLAKTEVNGMRVTVSSSRKGISLAKAKELLGSRRVKRVIREQIDKKAWDAQVAGGAITEAESQACVVEMPVSPHIYVNPVKGAETAQQAA